MRWGIIILLFIPLFVFGQKVPDDYDIYSQYLKIFQESKKARLNFVIKESIEVVSADVSESIKDFVTAFRSYANGKKGSISMMFPNQSFADTLKKDTMWIPLIALLNKTIKNKYVIKNKFSLDLSVTILANYQYDVYFQNNTIGDGWSSFHEDFPGKSYLINLSAVVNDGKRAIFYFASRCGGLCGEGKLVLFYKENLKWKFVQVLNIWQS